MGKLAELAKKMSTFLKVLPGEEEQVVYVGFKDIPNKFDPEKTTIQYVFMVGGEKKFWENGSPKVALFFDDKNEGDIISIKNVGDEKKAKYELAPVITQEKAKK